VWRRVTVGHRGFSIQAGRRAVVRVRLSRAARRALRRRRSMRLRAVVQTRSPVTRQLRRTGWRNVRVRAPRSARR
jgi:hypothetical protein